MSYDEFVRWCQYREQCGSLHAGLRIDRAIARALALYANSMSKNKTYKVSDFSPHDQIKPTNVDDPMAVFNVIKGATDGVSRNTDP